MDRGIKPWMVINLTLQKHKLSSSSARNMGIQGIFISDVWFETDPNKISGRFLIIFFSLPFYKEIFKRLRKRKCMINTAAVESFFNAS